MQAQKAVFLCWRQMYDNERKFHPPDLTSEKELGAVFVQCKSENKHVKENTRLLYRKSIEIIYSTLQSDYTK